MKIIIKKLTYSDPSPILDGSKYFLMNSGQKKLGQSRRDEVRVELFGVLVGLQFQQVGDERHQNAHTYAHQAGDGAEPHVRRLVDRQVLEAVSFRADGLFDYAAGIFGRLKDEVRAAGVVHRHQGRREGLILPSHRLTKAEPHGENETAKTAHERSLKIKWL